MVHAINNGVVCLNEEELVQANKSLRKRSKIAKISQQPGEEDGHTMAGNIMNEDGHAKSVEKRSSMHSHFNYMLQLRTLKINNGEAEGRFIYDLADLTYEDVDSSTIVGEWASYLKSVATLHMKPDNELISYGTAIGYMSAFKVTMIEKYHTTGVPAQLQSEIWSRMLSKIRQFKFQYAQSKAKSLFGSKAAATTEDKRGIVALGIWKGSLHNAEFVMLFDAMTHNCGRGSEVAILLWDSCELKKIQEAHGYEYETLSQHVLRSKTQGK